MLKTFGLLTLGSALVLTGCYGAAGLLACLAILGTLCAAVLVAEGFASLWDLIDGGDEDEFDLELDDGE